MRPPTPAIADRPDLQEYVADRAGSFDGRVGVLLGYPTGPTMADFDVVLSRRADRPYASASVIKLPILYTLYAQYDPTLSDLDERRQLTAANRVAGSGLLHLLDDPEPSLRDLARAMIAVSDNAATNELIDALGMATVNDVASDLGMVDTHLGRKMMQTIDAAAADDGDDDEAEPGTADNPVNTTSPRDCARLFADLWYGDGLTDAARAEQRAILGHQKDRRMVRRYVPYDLTVAHKTGWLPHAALDAGLIEREDEPPFFFAVFCDRADNGGDATDVVAEVGAATVEWLDSA